MMNDEFVYNSEEFKKLINSIISYIDGGTSSSKSLNDCCKKIEKLMNDLVQPGVWTGPSAKANYNSFVDAHNSLVNFLNAFVEVLTNQATAVNNAVQQLEDTNLASQMEGLDNFGNFNFSNIEEMLAQNVNIEEIQYKNEEISRIHDEISKVYEDVSSILTDSLIKEIEKIDNPEYRIFCGSAANGVKTELEAVVQQNSKTICNNLEICIKNVKQALTNANVIKLDDVYYNPIEFKKWAKWVNTYISSDDIDSLKKCCDGMAKNLHDLVQPGVWTGSAAKQNYENFKDLYKSIVDFCNKFASEFDDTVISFNERVHSLEQGNSGLYVDLNVLQTFGTIDYLTIDKAADDNIRTDEISYNFGLISNIYSELSNNIKLMNQVFTALIQKVNAIGDEAPYDIFKGKVANQTRNSMKEIITSNHKVISENLNTCVKNIAIALTNAQSFGNN